MTDPAMSQSIIEEAIPEQEARNILRILRRVETRVAKMKPDEDRLEAIADIKTLKRKAEALKISLSVHIFKNIVFSEVGRLHPDVMPMIIEAMDQPNNWWKAGETLSVADWADRFRAL